MPSAYPRSCLVKLILLFLLPAMLQAPLAVADQIFVADQAGELWRYGTEAPSRIHIGTLQTPMAGLTFGTDGRLFGLTSSGEVWTIDPETAQSVKLGSATDSENLDYRDLAQGDSETLLLLRWNRSTEATELSRWVLSSGEEQPLGALTHPSVEETLDIYSLLAVGPDRFWTMDHRTLYGVHLEALVAEDLESETVATEYPEVIAHDAVLDSSGSIWVLSEFNAGQRGLRLLPANLSKTGYGFQSGAQARAITVRSTPGACLIDPGTLCFQKGRFQVRLHWKDFDQVTGSGQAVVDRSEAAGQFWFFNAENRELLVKVVDGCSINQKYWISLAATTNVEFDLEVVDLRSGVERHYLNPLGEIAETVLDTTAFSCEPPAREGV